MILEWHEFKRRDWRYPIQLHGRHGINLPSWVAGGLRPTPTGWEAATFNPSVKQEFTIKEEAEAWLIAIVRLSS